MSKFTPGPWEASGNGIHKRLSPHYTTCIAITSQAPREQRVSVARLIAAAPEIYELWVRASERALCLDEMEAIREEAAALLARIDGDG